MIIKYSFIFGSSDLLFLNHLQPKCPTPIPLRYNPIYFINILYIKIKWLNSRVLVNKTFDISANSP